MSRCPNCGSEVDAGMKFCGECGTVLPQTKECPKCHSQLPMNAKFCQDCGYNFSVAPTASGSAGIPLMGDKNVIAGDVNNSVSMSNSNNTTNVTTNNSTNNTTNNVSNVSNVTNNSQVTNNTTTHNMYIKQEIKHETELDKEAKRVQIERLRLEKEQQEKEMARRSILAEASLEAEKTRKAVELVQEKMKLQEIEEAANKSPYSKNTFRKLGLWAGFLGLHYAYVKRWLLFAFTIALMIGMAMFGKQADSHDANATTVDYVEQPSSVKVQKLLQNGQVLILRDGKIYNVMGIEVR